MNTEQDVYEVKPEFLVEIPFSEIKVGDVLKLTGLDWWYYLFVSSVTGRGACGVWRKEKSCSGGGGGTAPVHNCKKERVLSPEVNHVRAFYNQVRIETQAMHVLVTFINDRDEYDCREIVVTGEDLHQQVAQEIRAMKKRFGGLEIVSISHSFLPLDVSYPI
jgi:hypothetical protein